MPSSEMFPGVRRPVRILLAEDETITALYAEELLIGLGFEICGVAATGPKAVEVAERTLPDLVLMDISLARGTDGVEAAREIQRRLDIPSIFVTAHSDPGTRLRADQVGHYGFLNKPYSAERLEPVLLAALRRLQDRGRYGAS